MADGGPDLGELLDRVANLPVEDAAVGDHDDGVEHPGSVLPQPNQLVGEPGDGVRLPATGRMLDEIPLPCAMPARVGQQPSHHVEQKQKLVTLLEEQKQALIHRAVTGKVDIRTGLPYPAYKPSGVEWLGEVAVALGSTPGEMALPGSG